MTISLGRYDENDALDMFMGFHDPVEARPVHNDDFIFTEEPEVEIPTALCEEDLSDFFSPAPTSKNILSRKRKSEDWDSKPLEKRGSFVKTESNTKTEFSSLAEQLSFDTELGKCSDLFVDMLLSDNKKKSGLVRRNSWSATPAISSKAAEAISASKQKRTRWTAKEMRALWVGIEQHGNNWRAIKKSFLTDRTYYQVKDKGRRLLASEGWISGRSKSDTDEAAGDARGIAVRVNKRFAKAQRKNRRR